MSLDEDLKAKGYHEYGPFIDNKIYPTSKHLVDLDNLIYLANSRKIIDFRIIQGLRVREDLKDFPDLYFIYILPSSEKDKEKQ